MSEHDNDLNSEALAKAIQAVGRKSLYFGGIVLLLTIIIGILEGSAEASRNGTPGWGSVFFMYGGIQSLAIAIPVAICLYIGATLISGMIAFVYFRFPKRK